MSKTQLIYKNNNIAINPYDFNSQGALPGVNREPSILPYKNGLCFQGTAIAKEWYDKNPSKQVRLGLAVKLEDNKLVVADNDENLYGITTIEYTNVIDDYSEYWHGAFEKDDLGRIQLARYRSYMSTIDGKVVILMLSEDNVVYRRVPNINDPYGVRFNASLPSGSKELNYIYSPKISAMYNPNRDYIARLDRPEWSAVKTEGEVVIESSEDITSNYVNISQGKAVNGNKFLVVSKNSKYIRIKL